ncbi:MAG: sigma-70 family RNA polymerase sigma factor [Acidobacteriota bacterium]
MLEADEERRLLAALAQGSRSAAETLVDRTYGRVFALVARLCGGDRELAADLTQETYRRAWAALATFNGRSQLATWLYRIAYNVFLNHLRRPCWEVPVDGEEAAAIPDCQASADDALISTERDELLRRAVLALPEEQRAVVVARFWAAVPVAEIARTEGLSEVGVRKRLRKALARLAGALEEASP